MDVDSLLDPPLVALDLCGKALYREMVAAEEQLVVRLVKAGCQVWRQQRDEQSGGPIFTGQWDTGLRRWFVLAPEKGARRLHRKWPELLEKLQPSRRAFLDYVVARKTRRTPHAGEQSVALPTWLEFEKAVRKATWSTAEAWRAGNMSSGEVLAFLRRREARCEELIDNAETARQKGRAQEYKQRLAEISTDIRRMEALHDFAGPELLCRVWSGTGTYLRLGFTDGTSHSTSVQHLLVATAQEGCALEPAATHHRTPRFGQPLLLLYGGRLNVYLAQDGQLDTSARQQRLGEIVRFIKNL